LAAEARELQDDGDYDKAIAAVRKKLDIERAVFGEFHSDLAESQRWLAEMCLDTQDFAAALSAAQGALGVLTRLHGAEHWRTRDAGLLVGDVNLARRLKPADLRRVVQSIDLVEKAFELYDEQGEIKQALELAERGLKIRRDVLGPNRQYTAEVLHLLGAIKSHQDSREGRKYFEQALAVRM
jgi:tetratricopeptide (TPR) repeat protein